MRNGLNEGNGNWIIGGLHIGHRHLGVCMCFDHRFSPTCWSVVYQVASAKRGETFRDVFMLAILHQQVKMQMQGQTSTNLYYAST